MNIAVLLIFTYVGKITSVTITDPNACPRKVVISDHSATRVQLVFECCSDYFVQNGTCQACTAGRFGKDCLLKCMPNYYGVQCKQQCNCTYNKKCDSVHGCVCNAGYTGQNCTEVCPVGTYGINCSKDCLCAHNDGCDHVTGNCICPPGWFGLYCIQECPAGKFGKNCNGTCDCPYDAKCDIVSGECIQCQPGSSTAQCNSQKDDEEDEKSNISEEKDKSKNTVVVYIMMSAAVMGLVCVVTVIVKAKQALCRTEKNPKKKTSKPEVKLEKAKRRRSSVQTQDTQTTPFIIETDVSIVPPPSEEDFYCEIGDINDAYPDQY